MSLTRRIPPKRLALAAALVLGLATEASATTQCDTDPNAVFFQATVDPTQLNKLLSRLGDKQIKVASAPLVLPGLCTDHQLTVQAGSLTLPFGNAPFTVTPTRGSIRVDLALTGPFVFGVDGGTYKRVNCDSSCVIDIPYLGEIFNGCKIEAGIVGPVLKTLSSSARFDTLNVSQRADTCVLGDCTAVHPLETTSTNLGNFRIDATGIGSCEVSLDFPDPFPDLSFDPCRLFDPLLEDLVQGQLEDSIGKVFVNKKGEGVLIKVFSRQIIKDGCSDIPEVKQCKQAQPTTFAGFLRGPQNPALNAALYILPLGLVGGLVVRVRRKRA